jgi:hypothetical protein
MHGSAGHRRGCGHWNAELVLNTSKRSKLLPALSALALLDLSMYLLSWVAGAQFALLIGSLFILVYVAYVVLATRELVTDPGRLHPFDLTVCRWSGPLALLIAVLLMLIVVVAVLADVTDLWFRSRTGLLIVKYAMEVGLILSVSARLAPARLGHVPPRSFWQNVSTPLLIIFGLYVVLIPFAELLGGCWPKQGSPGL